MGIVSEVLGYEQRMMEVYLLLGYPSYGTQLILRVEWVLGC